MTIEGKLAGILMQKFNHCCDKNYYENLTNLLNTLRIGEIRTYHFINSYHPFWYNVMYVC